MERRVCLIGEYGIPVLAAFLGLIGATAGIRCGGRATCSGGAHLIPSPPNPTLHREHRSGARRMTGISKNAFYSAEHGLTGLPGHC